MKRFVKCSWLENGFVMFLYCYVCAMFYMMTFSNIMVKRGRIWAMLLLYYLYDASTCSGDKRGGSNIYWCDKYTEYNQVREWRWCSYSSKFCHIHAGARRGAGVKLFGGVWWTDDSPYRFAGRSRGHDQAAGVRDCQRRRVRSQRKAVVSGHVAWRRDGPRGVGWAWGGTCRRDGDRVFYFFSLPYNINPP